MMMKKLLICLSLNLLSIMPIMAFYVDNINYAITSDTTVEVTSPQDSLPSQVVIPEQITYEGKLYTVTSIGSDAFRSCSKLTSVTIPNSITSIGSWAFALCDQLTSVIIGNGVTSIGTHAFYSCDNLISITIPNSVTSIAITTFQSCDNLTSVVVESGNTIYDSRDNCNAIIETASNTLIAGCQNTIIPNSVTSIGYNAFYLCSSLTSIEIPGSVTNIGNSAFYSCYKLTSVTIGNGVMSIGDHAFYACSSLRSIEIPNSVTSIGYAAFQSCSKLTSVTIGNGVTSIGSEAFSSCSKLTSVVVESGNTIYDSRDNCNAIIETASNTLIAGCQNTIIPNSVTSIGDKAFHGRSSLTSIEIPTGVTSIGDWAFYACSSLRSIEIPNSVTSIGTRAFNVCSRLTSVTIGNGVMSIGDHAFYACSSLRSIEIPNSVTSIGYRAFSDCDNLTSVVVESSNMIYDSRDNCNAIIETASNTLIAGCQNTIIPNSVTSIGDYAFYACFSLRSIEIPTGVTSIRGWAFFNCSKLTSVTIPNSVTSIGTRAFNLCDSLSSVYCAARIPPTLEGDFSDKIIDTLYVLAGFVETYKQSPWAGYFLNIIEDGDADVVDVTTTSATLLWSSSPSVKYYVINVYKEDAPYAEFIVDDKGVILSENYEDGTAKASTTRDLARLNVPIKKMGTDTTTNNTEYFVIQLDGLQSGTQYSYTVRGMNAKDECIYEETVQFTTLTMSAITEIFMDDQEKHTTTKILHRGNLYILHPDGSLYDMKGTKVNLKNITVR